jgi:hypothetical protein
MKYITRPTVMGMAFLNVAAKAIGKRSADKALHDPKIHWVARRVAASQSKHGLVSEPTSRHNLMTPKERADMYAVRKALGIEPMFK